MSLARPEDGAALTELALAPGLPRELPLRRRDGSLVWVEAAEYPVDFEGAAAAQVSVSDVSARREAEEKRRELVELSATRRSSWSTPRAWRSWGRWPPPSPTSSTSR